MTGTTNEIIAGLQAQREELLSAANAAYDALTDERAEDCYKAESARNLWNAIAKATKECGTNAVAATPEITPTPPAIGTYWHGQGGIYMGTRPAIGTMPAAHMVYSEEQSEHLTWGVYGKRIPGADSAHDGRANTQALIAAAAENGGSPAATWAQGYTKDGHSDFFLPSQIDLILAHAHARAAGKFAFDKKILWSSTQYSAHFAFAQGFEYGDSRWYAKDNKFRVRALRLIQL